MNAFLGILALVLLVGLAACDPGEPRALDADEVPETTALPECDPDDGGLTLADGFCAMVVHQGVGRARHLAVAENGDIYVRLRQVEAGGGIVALRDTTGDGRADVVERFRGDAGTGIGIHDGYLYFSTDTEVFRVRLPQNGELVPTGEPEPIVGGFPEQRSHSAKPFAFDDAGNIYVNIGSPTNNCQPIPQDRDPGVPGQDPCPEFPEQAAIWRFDADRPGQQQGPDGEPYVIGFRNAVALAWNHDAGALYAVQHGRDLLDANWPQHYTAEQNAELPSEELHRLQPGDTLSYPYCYHDPHRDELVRAPEFGGDGESTEGCERYREPLVAYPAHFAPNDLLFYTGELFPAGYRNGVFIAWHGSWNRAPLEQRGYKVTFQPMSGGAPTGDWRVFATDFAGERPIQRPQDAEHRPMGLAEGPDGSLYVVDSHEGRIWRIVPTGR